MIFRDAGAAEREHALSPRRAGGERSLAAAIAFLLALAALVALFWTPLPHPADLSAAEGEFSAARAFVASSVSR